MFRSVLLFYLLTTSVFAETGLGPGDIVADCDFLYILEHDARQIRKLRIDTVQTETNLYDDTIKLPVEPSRLRMSPDKRYLAVTGGGHLGTLLLVSTKDFKIVHQIDAGHTPSDAAIAGNKIYVANRFDETVTCYTFDNENIRFEKNFSVGREPFTLAVTPDGKTLIVAGHQPEGSAVGEEITARIRFIDTETGKTETMFLPSGSMAIRDCVLSPDGKYVFITGIQAHFNHIADSVTNGWLNNNYVFVTDIARRHVTQMLSLDDNVIGSANPWGISVSDDNRFLVVCAAGSGDVILIDLALLQQEYKEMGNSEKLPSQMRIPFGLKGMRYAAMTHNRIFVPAYFEDALGIITPKFTPPYRFSPGLLPKDGWVIQRKKNKVRLDTNTEIRTNVPLDPAANVFQFSPGIRFERQIVRLAPEPDWTPERFGEMLFHDGTLCDAHWMSCITCHPDGRTDVLNWDLLNDGLNNPKNTKSLLLSHDTPPSMATGVRKTAEIAVRKGFSSILFTDPVDEDECQAVDAYLQSLQPVPSPKLIFDRKQPSAPGKLSASALRGKSIFRQVNCSRCHPEPLFTDMQMHDVGTQSIGDPQPQYDTPVLIEIWRTAPYLHDGRYVTLKELLTTGGHGEAKNLTEQELDDLTQYLLSL
ncbi:hypothetical protein FACS189419_03250 [Planctomycetales bacterium]|nr:hypothetical protein FACS189419_03250 [Planctomycetales bacterium]